MIRPHRPVGLIALGLAAFVAGCRGEVDPTVSVSGSVTVDGQPLPTGNITFMPKDGKGGVAGAAITGGKYEARVEPGPKQVSIVANREAKKPGAKADPHAGAPTEQYLPARFNTKTQLETDIPADGGQGIDFQLATDAKN